MAARIRTIKPDFFRHEGLQDLGPIPMLVFSGLWCQADREGRFLWKPRLLKLDILPFLEFDIGAVLDQLAGGDFIRRYEVGGQAYGYIPSWGKHQIINNRETASILPDPHASGTTDSHVNHASGTRQGSYQGEGKGREREGERNDASSTRGEDPISPSMVAQGVMHELGLGGSDLLRVLTDICAGLSGVPPEKLRDDLIAAWKSYKQAMPSLEWTYGSAEAFFGGGLWGDSKVWPWKDGQRPKADKSRRYDDGAEGVA